MEKTNLFIFALIFFVVTILGIFFIFADDLPFTKAHECKELMQPIQNVTIGQGEKYDYSNGNCILYYPFGSAYGSWETSLSGLEKSSMEKK